MVSSSGVWKALLRKSLSDAFNARKGTLRDMLFQLLRHQKVVFRFFVGSDINLREEKEEIMQT